MQMTVMGLVLARVRPCLHLPSQHLSHQDVVIGMLNQQVKSQTTASKRGAYDIIILYMQFQLPTSTTYLGERQLQSSGQAHPILQNIDMASTELSPDSYFHTPSTIAHILSITLVPHIWPNLAILSSLPISTKAVNPKNPALLGLNGSTPSGACNIEITT